MKNTEKYKALGAKSDIERAHKIVKRLLSELCEFGFSNYFRSERGEPMPDHIAKEIAHELDKYYLKTKELPICHLLTK